mgnify:FL=1
MVRTVGEPAMKNSKVFLSRNIFLSALVVVMVTIAYDTKIVEIGSQEDQRLAEFDPDTFGITEFPRISEAVRARAVEASVLLEAIMQDKQAAIKNYGTPGGIGAYMPVYLEGVMGEGKSGIFDFLVDKMPNGTRVRLQTGPAINGTELRDITGDILFGAFKNQIEFQDVGTGINKAMASSVLTDLDRDSLKGKSVSVVGVFNLINAKNWLITPVSLELN